MTVEQGTPKMTFKSTDGKISLEMYVAYESGIGYYFDRNIEGIDTSKEYYIEVKLQGKNNIAEEASKTQEAKITKNGQIGTCTNGNKVTVSKNHIKIEKSVKAKTMTKTIEEKQEPKKEKENKTNENLMVNKNCEN